MLSKTPTNKAYSTASVSPVVFRRLLMLAVVCFFSILVSDYSFNLLSKFDSVGYPLSILAYFTIYLLSVNNKVDHKNLLLFSYFTLVSYLISVSLYQHLYADLTYSNSLQWLAINYVFAYLYLEVKYVTIIVIVIYVFTVISHFFALIQNYTFAHSVGVSLNIAISHAIYIGLLSAASRLRVKTDQTEERADSLENIAYVDLLTRILNRRGIDKVIAQIEVDRVKQPNGYAFLMIDIDHFKLINDKYGHLVGDDVLHNIASQLSRSIRPNDLIGRWGGEEFMVVTLNSDIQQATKLGERIRLVINELKMDDMPSLSVSIGVAHSSEADSREELLQIVDENLYTAKQSGRNKVCTSLNS